MKFFTKKRIIYGIIGIFLGVGIWFVFFRKNGPAPEILTVRPTAFSKQVSVAGTVKAAESADLSFGETGIIAAVNVQPGEFVAAGSILGSLENNDLQASVLQRIALLQAQQANLKIAQQGGRQVFVGGTTLQNFTSSSTASNIDVQQAEVNAAEADVLNAEAALHKTQIIAPFDGLVGRVDAKVGETAAPDTIEISMQSAGPFQIESFVPELDIPGVAVGDSALVTLDSYPNVSFPAKIISVDSGETVRSNVTTYKVKLQFLKTDPRIKSGMTANVVITTVYRPNEIVIPSGAIYYQDGKKYVQLKVGNNLVGQPVQTGDSTALGDVEIISGLKPGDQLVLSPIAKK